MSTPKHHTTTHHAPPPTPLLTTPLHPHHYSPRPSAPPVGPPEEFGGGPGPNRGGGGSPKVVELRRQKLRRQPGHGGVVGIVGGGQTTAERWTLPHERGQPAAGVAPEKVTAASRRTVHVDDASGGGRTWRRLRRPPILGSAAGRVVGGQRAGIGKMLREDELLGGRRISSAGSRDFDRSESTRRWRVEIVMWQGRDDQRTALRG